MRIAILGAAGNMGVRYRAILKHLKIDVAPLDVENPWDEVSRTVNESDGVIIATPTALHADHIIRLAHNQTPILVEKPISKDLELVKRALNHAASSSCALRLVNQYKFTGVESHGPTSYNYFKHGGDGLFWDCISLISLARGSISLREDSPIWECWLNGCELSPNEMDNAYILMIKDWLKNPSQDLREIYASHEKVADLEKRSDYGSG